MNTKLLQAETLSLPKPLTEVQPTTRVQHPVEPADKHN
jgi:hypothetical protein